MNPWEDINTIWMEQFANVCGLLSDCSMTTLELKIYKIHVSTFINPDRIPDLDRLEDKTEECGDNPYVGRLIDTTDEH